MAVLHAASESLETAIKRPSQTQLLQQYYHTTCSVTVCQCETRNTHRHKFANECPTKVQRNISDAELVL